MSERGMPFLYLYFSNIIISVKINLRITFV